jgi:hypothetical protein
MTGLVRTSLALRQFSQSPFHGVSATIGKRLTAALRRITMV